MDFTKPRRPLGAATSPSSTSSYNNRYSSRLPSSSSSTTGNRNSSANNRIPNRNKGILLIFITLTLFGIIFWYSFFHRSAAFPLLNTIFQDLDKSFNSQVSASRMGTLQSQYGAAHMQNILAQPNTNNNNILRGTNNNNNNNNNINNPPNELGSSSSSTSSEGSSSSSTSNTGTSGTTLQKGMDEHVHQSVELAKRMEELDRLKREQAILEEQIRKASLSSKEDTSSSVTGASTGIEEVGDGSGNGPIMESWISRQRRMKLERRQQRQRQRQGSGTEETESVRNNNNNNNNNNPSNPSLPGFPMEQGNPLQAPLPKGGSTPIRVVNDAVRKANENVNNGLATLPDLLNPPPLPPGLVKPETIAKLEQQKQQLLLNNPDTVNTVPVVQSSSSSSSSLDPTFPCLQSSHLPSKHPLLFTERYVKDQVLPKEKCENFFGNTWLRSFADSRREVCVPGNSNTGSRIWRYDAATGARFSWMKNVKIDFGQMHTVGDNRQFSGGFVQVACDETTPGAVAHIADGRSESGLGGFQRLDGNADLECDEWEHSPTIVIQHDDIGNMYHNLADHFRTWLALALVQQPVCEKKDKVLNSKTPTNSKKANMCPASDELSTYYPSIVGLSNPAQEVSNLRCAEDESVVYGVDPDNALLINMDGRVMCNVVNPDGTPVTGPREDCEGPYFPQYRKWFGKGVNKARDYGSKKVCFSSLAWAVNSPESHPWAYFGEPSECDGRSPLWMQYTTYVLNRWDLLSVKPLAVRSDCQSGCKPYIRILYVVRKKKPFNPQPVRDRVIANEGEFIAMLQTAVPNIDIEVDPADFTGMSFEEQLRRVRRSHLMIGMHGAGMVHAIHLSQTDTCNGPTGVIELLPVGHGEWGIGHLTSYEGHRYWRWASTDTSRETGSGTNVDLDTIKTMVQGAINYNLEGRQAGC